MTDAPAPASAAAPTRTTAVFPALVSYTLRACLPARRRLGLLAPALGAVLFGLLTHAVVSDSAERAFAQIASAGLFGIILPIGCLVVGDAVLGAEVRAGTLHYTWLSPVPRWAIVLARWLAGSAVAVLWIALPCALAAVVAGASAAAVPVFVAAAAGCAGYVALFAMIGALSRRAVVWSLAVVILMERLLGAALAGIAQLSPGWLARQAYAGIGPQATDLLRRGVPDGWSAVGRLALVSAIALAIASWRLSHLRLVARSD
jgi:ABC-2 type transport system permease protein